MPHLHQQAPTGNVSDAPAPGGSVFVGREVELGRLIDAFERASQGCGGVAVISGVAGVGKSRLVREARSRVLASGAQWYETQARIESSGTPYSLLIELLENVWGIERAGRESEITSRLSESCSRLLPADPDAPAVLGRLFGIDTAQWRMDSAEWRDRLYETVGAMVDRLSDEGPVVACTEDLQWADESSLDLIRRLGRRNAPSDARVLLVCTHRPSMALFCDAEYAEMGDACARIGLDVLSFEHAQQLVRVLLGGRRASRELCRRLAESATGSPLGLEEHIRTLIQTGDLVKGTAGWVLHDTQSPPGTPLSVDDVVAERVRLLGDEARLVLGEAAIIGTVIPYDTLRDITSAPEMLDPALLLLGEEGLVEPVADGAGRRYNFRHELMQKAAYEVLDDDSRVGLHERLARVLELEYADRAQAMPERLAFHYQRGLSRDKAMRYLLMSAYKSASQLAFDEAQRFFEQSYELAIAAREDTAEGKALLIDILNGWAALCADRAEHGRVWDLLAPHLRIAESLDDQHRLAAFYLSLAAAEMGRGAFPEALEFSRKGANLALHLGDPALVARAHSSVAWSILELGDFDAVVEHGWAGHHASRLAADRPGSAPGMRDLAWTTLNAVGLAHLYRGDVRAADELASYLAEGSDSEPLRQIIALQCRGYARQAAGEYGQAIAVFDAVCERISDPGWWAVAQFYRAIALIDDGRSGEAEQILRTLWDQCRDRYVRIEFYVQMQLGSCLAHQGAESEGSRLISEAAAALERLNCVSQRAIAELLLGKAHLLLLQRASGDGATIEQAAMPGVATLEDAAREAERWHRQCIEDSERMGARAIACEACIDLSRTLTLAGRAAEARQWAMHARADAKDRGARGFLDQACMTLAQAERLS